MKYCPPKLFAVKGGFIKNNPMFYKTVNKQQSKVVVESLKKTKKNR